MNHSIAARAMLVVLTSFAAVGCAAFDRAPDRCEVRAEVAPALACDNAARCADAMEADLVHDARVAAADRAAVAQTIRALRAAAAECALVAETSRADPAHALDAAADLDARVDAAQAQWAELNTRYGRLANP